MADRNIKYTVSADNTEFKEGMAEVQEVAEALENPFAAVSSLLEKTNSEALGMVAAFGAIGGAALGLESVIEHMKQVGEQAQSFKNLAIETGVSRDFIASLNVAAQIAGVSTDKFQQAFSHLSTAMAEARDKGGPMLEIFQRLGVTQEDLAKGDVEAVLRKIAVAYHDSADNAAKLEINSKLFGGRLAEILPLLNDLARYLKEADESSLKMTEDQQAEILELKDHWEGLFRTISAGWKDVMVVAASAINGQIALIHAAAPALKSIFLPAGIGDSDKGAESQGETKAATPGPKPSLGDGLATFDALKSQLRQQEAEENVSFEARLGFERKFWQDKLAAAVAGGDKYKETAVQIRETLSQLDEKASKDNTRMQGWQQEIEAQRVAFDTEQAQQGTFQTFSEQSVADYWGRILARTDLSKNERLEVERQWLAAEQQLHQQATAAELARFKTEEAAYKNDIATKLSLAQQEMARVAEIYGQESEIYRTVKEQEVTLQREADAQIIKLAEDANKAQEAAATKQLDFEKQMAQLTLQAKGASQSQILQMEAEFEQRAYQMKVQDMMRTLQLDEQDPDKNAAKIQQDYQQIEALAQAHANNMLMIQKKEQMSEMSDFNAMTNGLSQNWSKGIMQMLNGTLHWHQMLRNLWKSISQEFLKDMVEAPLQRWIQKELMQTAATLTGANTRTAINTAANQQSMAESALMGVKEVAISAYKAMAAAYSAIAGIPYIGPFLAPAMAVAAGAAVFEIGSKIASAEGGYDIPAGVNPLIQAHSQEMVLPRAQADVIRGMASNGTGMPGHTVNVNYHDNSGRLTADDIMQHSGTIAKAVKQEIRRFNTRA